MVLVLDQLALRAGQSEHFIKLCQCPFFIERWRHCPNIQISSALAKFKAKEAANSRITLAKCVQQYPWIFTRLLTELKIEPLPPSLWGLSARSEREIFECEMYIICAKDLWETSDAKSFLVEVTKSVTVGDLSDPKAGQLTIDEARHVLLSGNQAMAGLVSTRFASLSTSASDPLPPVDNDPSYRFEIEANGHFPAHLLHRGEMGDAHLANMPSERETQDAIPSPAERQNEDLEGFAVLHYFLSSLPNWITPNTVEGSETDPNSISQRLAEFVQFGSRIPEYLAAHGRHLVEALRGTWGTNNGPWEVRYLTNRLHEALNAREQEDGEQEDREQEDLEQEDREQINPEQDGHERQSLEPTNPPLPMARDASVREANELPYLFPPYPSDPEDSPPRVQEAEENIDDNLDDDDDDRNQRWLAGKGMLRLRDFAARHGTDDSAWSEDPDVEAEGRAIVDRYAERVLKLGQQRTQTFIVNYVLRQGTTVEVRDLVIRAIQKIKRERGQDGNI